MYRHLLFGPVLTLTLAAAALADEVRTETVRFEKGTSGAEIEDSIQGYDSAHYLLRARGGQTMTVAMTTDNASAYFNIFEPGKTPGEDAAMHVGSVAGLSFEGALPADGEYLIQVYLMRNAARRDEVARYTLEIGIDAGAAARADAKVAGTDFHATGRLGCARHEGQPLGQCDFGVKRLGDGNAELHVFFGDGDTRIIHFADGAPVGSDADAELNATLQSDLHVITIGAERFEVVDAILTGG